MSDQHTVSINLSFSKERLALLLMCGLEGGINYWGEIVDYVTPEEPVKYAAKALPSLKLGLVKHADFPLCAGGALVIRECHSGEEHRLDLAAIERGLACFGKVSPKHFGQFLAGHEDTETGDLFVQACLLGESKYT